MADIFRGFRKVGYDTAEDDREAEDGDNAREIQFSHILFQFSVLGT